MDPGQLSSQKITLDCIAYACNDRMERVLSYHCDDSKQRRVRILSGTRIENNSGDKVEQNPTCRNALVSQETEAGNDPERDRVRPPGMEEVLGLREQNPVKKGRPFRTRPSSTVLETLRINLCSLQPFHQQPCS